MKTIIESMERVDNKINEMLDNPFCPESVENMQLMLKNLIEIFKEDYL